MCIVVEKLVEVKLGLYVTEGTFKDLLWYWTKLLRNTFGLDLL